MLPDHRGPSPELARALESWKGAHYWSPRDGAGRLVLVRALSAPPRERWWLHALLFLATFVTVGAGGALLGGGLPLRASPPLVLSWSWLSTTATNWMEAVRAGADFAMALMGILLAHECGHYFLAKRYLINASPPYFLPAPYQLNFIGTFGAFIRLRSPIADRRQLMDVGAAGPWVGFLVAIVFLLLGLSRSDRVSASLDASFLVPVLGLHNRGFGDSLLTYWLRHWFFGGQPILLHPLALAGWFGVFITGLNLMPLGQLDGGHVLYALIGRRQGVISVLAWFALLPLGGWFFWGWLVWAALLLLVSRGRIIHPSVVDQHRSIPKSRVMLGWATILLFAVTFTPIPVYVPLPW